jgi:hypothetical protein
MDTIDLSNETINITGDKSFEMSHVRQAMDYLKNIRDHAVDYVVPGEKIQIKEVDDKTWQLWLESVEGIKVFKPTSYATRQTITKTPLPKRYHDELVEKRHIDEAVKHLNMWLHEDESQRIRSVGPWYRAIVSPGYGAFDNYDIFANTAGTIKAANMMRNEQTSPIQFQRADVSEEHMYLSVLDYGRGYDIGKGDTHFPYIRIQNSEVGAGAFSVDSGFFRAACENGMIYGKIARRIHKSEKLQIGEYSADTIQTQNELVVKIVRDQVGMALTNDQLYDRMAAELRESKEIKIIPTEAIEKVRGILELTEDDENDIINAMMGDRTIQSNDRNTAFALLNAVTLVAKDRGIERRHELEQSAGQIKQVIKVLA